MGANSPVRTYASDTWWESARLDEAPTFTTRQHLEYLVELMTKEWRKTAVKWHNASRNTAIHTLPKFDELEFFDYDENCMIRIDLSTVPKSIFSKVDDLQQMQRIGLPHLAELSELIKEDLAKCPLASTPDEEGNDKETIFFDMITELARNRMYAEYIEKEDMGIHLTVVFVDESGSFQLKQCHLRQDTDFASFLVLMDKYPKEFDLNVNWAASFWDEKIRALKSKGYDGHSKLVEIEQLIASFKAKDRDAGPKWMFFKSNQEVSYAKAIENENDLKKILEIFANPAKRNRLVSMVRVCRAVDKDLISVCDELKFFEAKLRDSVGPRELSASPSAQGDKSGQRSSDQCARRIDQLTADDCSFDLLARTVGLGFNFAWMSDHDDDEKDDDDYFEASPMGLENINKSGEVYPAHHDSQS